MFFPICNIGHNRTMLSSQDIRIKRLKSRQNQKNIIEYIFLATLSPGVGHKLNK